MYRLRFSPAARSELDGAEDYYGTIRDELAAHFRDDIEHITGRIITNPLQFPVMLKGVRKALLSGFPYLLLFRVEGDFIFVVACFHASRNPKRWRRRV